MKLLIDMNLAPVWAVIFRRHGWEALHWSAIGDPRAPDSIVMEWAREHGYIVVTHDLDFGALLAMTHARGPSVIQVRTQDVTPRRLEDLLVDAIRQYEPQLEAGALIIVDEGRMRARILPLGP
jgi:predicted nuclease of predicted toxin-antitoxin system